jgi:hypothetical protein
MKLRGGRWKKMRNGKSKAECEITNISVEGMNFDWKTTQFMHIFRGDKEQFL